MEHTSHHPPIANFLLKHEGFDFWGRYEFKAELHKLSNKLAMVMEGPNHFDFKDESRISFNWPDLMLLGMFWGDRRCKYHNVMTFEDRVNKLKCWIKIGDAGDNKEYKKRVDAFSGSIYSYDPSKKPEKGKDKV
mmetsp:Transcript_135897/g.192182  ORF Transcript_135897/g.192182 Transcript_135897/m.192182 type:complete len:134 (+) Transcript_135897:287-688(+)